MAAMNQVFCTRYRWNVVYERHRQFKPLIVLNMLTLQILGQEGCGKMVLL